MKRFLVLWAAALAAGAAGCGTLPPVEHVKAVGSLDQVGLQVYWETTGQDMDLAGGEGLQKLWRVQDGVYCLTNLNRLISLDPLTGVAQWTVQVAPYGMTVFRPTVVTNVSLTEKLPGAAEMVNSKLSPMPPIEAVVINSSSQVLVIDRKKGRVVRRIDLEYGAGCGGASDGAIFVVGASGGRYYSTSLQQGVLHWPSWAGADIQAPIESFGGSMYIATVSSKTDAVVKGNLLCARASRTAPDPRKRTLGGPVTAALYVDARGCFVPSTDHFLYAFTPDLSAKLWDHPFGCGGPLRTPVQVGENTVFQRAAGDKFYAINLSSGQERWTLPDAEQVLAIIGTAAGSKVYLRDSRNRILQVDEIMGTVEASAPLGLLNLFAGNTTEPAVYAAWTGGRVVCLKPLTAGRRTMDALGGGRP